ncbi:MAG TPA: hypothetical protein VGJ15_02305, partial [Pirellulales bacterium]
MSHEDPISDLLRMADQAASPLPSAAYMAEKVERRRAARSARAKRVKAAMYAASIGTAVAVAVLISIHAFQSPQVPNPSAPVDSQIASNSPEESSTNESTV